MTRESSINAVAEFMLTSEQEELLISVAGTQVAEDKYEFRVAGVNDKKEFVDLFEFEAANPEAAKTYFESIVEDASQLAIAIASQTKEFQA